MAKTLSADDSMEMTLKHQIKQLDDKTFVAGDEEGRDAEYKRIEK